MPFTWSRIVSFCLSRDPTTGLWLFACWSVFEGVLLLLPTQIFKTVVIFHLLNSLPISEDVWGVMFLIDAVGLFAAPLLSAETALRTVIMLVSGLMWMFYGAMLLAGSGNFDNFSAVGALCIFGGVCCLAAMAQWVNVKWVGRRQWKSWT